MNFREFITRLKFKDYKIPLLQSFKDCFLTERVYCEGCSFKKQNYKDCHLSNKDVCCDQFNRPYVVNCKDRL